MTMDAENYVEQHFVRSKDACRADHLFSPPEMVAHTVLQNLLLYSKFILLMKEAVSGNQVNNCSLG
jgi:hypothetical protein